MEDEDSLRFTEVETPVGPCCGGTRVGEAGVGRDDGAGTWDRYRRISIGTRSRREGFRQEVVELRCQGGCRR